MSAEKYRTKLGNCCVNRRRRPAEETVPAHVAEHTCRYRHDSDINKKVELSQSKAKLTARCALYMGALKIFGCPWLCPRLLFPKCLLGIFVPIEPINVHTKLDVCSFTLARDNRGYPKTLVSPWIRPRSLMCKILMGFCSDGPCECTGQIWSP